MRRIRRAAGRPAPAGGHLRRSRRKGNWQIVWKQTGAIGPLPLPS
jgi:hypothetical protein